MADNTFAVVLFSLSSLELAASLVLHFIAGKPIRSNANMLTKISSQMQTNGLTECNHCHHIVARYFIDGTGAPTCANCSPDGFADAVASQKLNAR